MQQAINYVCMQSVKRHPLSDSASGQRVIDLILICLQALDQSTKWKEHNIEYSRDKMDLA